MSFYTNYLKDSRISLKCIAAVVPVGQPAYLSHCDVMVLDIRLHSRSCQGEPVSRWLALSTPASAEHQ